MAQIRENPYHLTMAPAKAPLLKAHLSKVWTSVRSLAHKRSTLARPVPPIMVPIRALGTNQRNRIRSHLLSLDAHDRYLRFGYAVQDEQIHLYVDTLNFERDEVFGIFNHRLQLLAVAHLAFGTDDRGDSYAEFGVSVLSRVRGRKFGARLFERATMIASNHGVTTMVIHALSENAAMLRIARTAGARVVRDGTESEAYLRLPQATLNSRLAEVVQQQFAQVDYQLKRHAGKFRKLLASL
jgi:GNAT superfamily N-acetyltransferase